VINLRKKQRKMHLIRFVLIPNPFQMKLMKVKCMMKNMMNKEFEHEEELQVI
jgi:hypothetical protein